MIAIPSEKPPTFPAAGHFMSARATAAMTTPKAPSAAIMIASVCI